MSSKVFYAVANGRTKGIFLTWTECEKSVKDFPGAKFKKFTSEQEANNFCKNPSKGFIKYTQVQKKIQAPNEFKSKYSDITFKSDSDSDSNSESDYNSKITSKHKSISTKHFVNTRAEEDNIRANINFDTSSESEDDKLTNTVFKQNTVSKITIEDLDVETDEKDTLEDIMKKLSKSNDKEPTKILVLSELGDFVPDIIVYTDGACIENGGSNAKAGIGIYFGPEDPRNVSEKIQGKQSNNTAELSALARAYSILSTEIANKKKVAFFTDSLYSISCLTTYGDKLDKEGWKKIIPNKELVKQIYEQFACKSNSNIKLVHIKAHTGKQDIHSLGNEQADHLANASISTLEKKDEVKKIYFKISFDKKDHAKKLGCRWDPDRKLWYAYESNAKAFEQFGGKI
jgi:ribonuclease HI